jgi:hypothetical protein
LKGVGDFGVDFELVQLLVDEKEYDISWAHVELEAGLGKLKQAADVKHEDHRVEMACSCQQPSPV